MVRNTSRGLVLLGILALLAMPAAARNGIEPIHHPGGLAFDLAADYERAVLSVSGPDGVEFTEEFAAGASPALGLEDAWGNALPDGQYKWELSTEPRVSQALRREMNEARASGDQEWMSDLAARLPRGEKQSGSFRVLNGEVLSPDRPEMAARGEEQAPVSDSSPGIVGVSAADQVITDDLIVDGSICAGFDCVNGESFGFDTLRLKENNLRIKFDDTSVSASFPKNDWQLTANDTSNGGAEKFSIDDITGGRTPFTIEAGTRSHQLYVDNGGRVGFGTNTPVVDLHVKSGNTPTLRLEQDGSSGFTAQTWDVAGNETNFFLRDATNGSTLPLRIRPGAPSSAIDIAASGNIGLSTSSPSEALHVRRTGASTPARILIEDAYTQTSSVIDIKHPQSSYIRKQGVATGGIGSELWIQFQANSIRFRDNTLSQDPFIFNTTNGNLTITGDFITPTNTYPDYVFENDYELMDLEELGRFVETNKHLPNVPSQADIDAAGGKVKMNELQIKLLEKVEELTLYTLQQQKQIEKLSGAEEERARAHGYIEQLNKVLESKDEELAGVLARLARLEQRFEAQR